MFVDNPVGTGFSFVDTDSYVQELPAMADQFIQFLEKWFAMFPEFEHDDVSHGGKYSECITNNCRFILQGNHTLDSTSRTFRRQF